MTSELTTTVPAAHAQGTMTMATTRQAAEVQSAMIVAKNFPRDETAAIARITQACRRKSLAECAMYAYPRGGTKVTGPSIRLAEALAQAWGNIDYGVIELEKKPGESVAMAYAWDLETNVRRQMVFTVPHIRSTREGNQLLTDPRDIYEMVANQGARRVRSCILGVIPGDVEDLAVAECEKTLKAGGGKEPLIDRVRKMVVAFNDIGVSSGMIEQRLGHKVEACIEQDLIAMQKIFCSIRDGMSKREDWFTFEKTAAADTQEKPPTSRAEAASSKMKKPQPKKEQPTEQPANDGPPQAEQLSNLDRYLLKIASVKTMPDLESLYDEISKMQWDDNEHRELQLAMDSKGQEI